MNIEITNKQLFKVKCIGGISGLTLGKEYYVFGVEFDFYTIENDRGVLESYFQERFEIVETLIKDKPLWITSQITKQNMFLIVTTKGCEMLTNGKIRVEKLMLG